MNFILLYNETYFAGGYSQQLNEEGKRKEEKAKDRIGTISELVYNA